MNGLTHRGPNASGSFVDRKEQLWLGHTRLSIIDLSEAANQPFLSSNGRYVIAYNGEIYNHRELANKHALALKTSSDTEVFVELFAKMGAACLSELNGMFGALVYDKVDERLFICRDRLGIKPLYYAVLPGGGYAFASELPALLEIMGKPKVREAGIGEFLHRGYIPEPNTFYEGVYKFPAGSYGWCSGEKMDIKPFWRAEDCIEERLHTGEKKVIDRVHELLRDSVKLRLMADVPFGTFLSGGADSGLVSALAADISPTPINTFNVGFDDAPFDETLFAREMAELIGSNHHHLNIGKAEVMENFEVGVRLVGEPFADSSVLPTMGVSKFASGHVKMALSGDGGDELFMGYGAYNWAERLNTFPFWTGRRAIAKVLRMRGGNRNNRAANVFDAPSKSGLPAHIFSQEQNLFTQREIERITEAAFTDPYKLPDLKRNLTPSEAQAFFDLTNYLKDDLLVKVDRSSMRYGLEVRVPFIDHRLVQYALNIDPALKTKNGETKYPIKKIMEQYYPNQLIYRKKWGFSIPLEKWLRNSTEFEATPISAALTSKYKTLENQYSSNIEFGYLYNRIYALRCLSQYYF